MAGAYQTTLKNEVVLSGVGLHSGAPATVRLLPAPAGSGVAFRRVDLLGAGETASQAQRLRAATISARYDSVADTRLGTTIANGDGASVATIEHLRAAIAGVGVDNVLVEIDGPETPILDGSAAPFIAALVKAGLRPLKSRRRYLRIIKPFRFAMGDRVISASPADSFQISVGVDFDDPAIGAQRTDLDIAGDAFSAELAAARTFCLLRDVEAMRAAGLARGGSLDNAVVVDQGRVLNDDGLRFDDEFVRHKALDLVGDLALAGAPIMGRIEADKPGHDLNNRFLRALFAQEDAWTLEELADEAFVREDYDVAQAAIV